MVYEEVLASAFLGCGKRLSDVRLAKKWRKTDESHRRHYAESGSGIGALARVGPIIAGQLLSTRSYEDAVEAARSMDVPWQYRPGVMADLALLGHCLIDEARRCVPDPFRTVESFVYGKSLGLPATLKGLGRQWRKGDRHKKREICELLSYSFRRSGYRSSEEIDDRLNQPAIRVLPRYFGRWQSGEHPANCLGKSMLVAGFARKLKIPALAITPTKVLGALFLENYAAILDVARRKYPGVPAPLSSEQQTDLEEAWKDTMQQLEEASWTHLAIALQAEPGVWILVDSNMGLTSFCPEEWKLDDVYARLKALRPALPTVSLLLEDRQVHAALDQQVETAERCCAELPGLIEPVPATASNEEVVEALARSKLLDRVLEWKYFQLDLPKSASRRFAALCALHECCIAKDRRSYDGGPAPKVLWFCFLNRPERWFIEQFDPGEAYEALRSMCYRFATRSAREVLSELDRIQYGNRCVHPHNQVSLVGTGLAIPALAHVALARGLPCAEEIEPILNSHCFDLHRLLYSAGGLLRTTAVDTRHAHLSASVLRGLPFRPFSADRVLSALGWRE